MDCPICQVTLQLSDRHGVEIDYCPKCRGIWLDRGELEKLVELSVQAQSPAPPPMRYSDDGYLEDQYAQRRDSSNHQHNYRSRKKESWLGNLFDFD